MEASPILLQKKYARIINMWAEQAGIDAREAMELFYNSITYKDMSEGVSQMHCRSDEYLVEELKEEYE